MCNTSSVRSLSSTVDLLVFHLAPLNPPPLPQSLRKACIHSFAKRVKYYNYCRCWNVDPVFLTRRLPLGYICNTFLSATRQLFLSSAYFSATAELMLREHALMLSVSRAQSRQHAADDYNWSYFHRLAVACSRITVCPAFECENTLSVTCAGKRCAWREHFLEMNTRKSAGLIFHLVCQAATHLFIVLLAAHVWFMPLQAVLGELSHRLPEPRTVSLHHQPSSTYP